MFKKNGTVTAGTASGICDGAGAIVLASEEACKAHNLKPLARLVRTGEKNSTWNHLMSISFLLFLGWVWNCRC